MIQNLQNCLTSQQQSVPNQNIFPDSQPPLANQTLAANLSWVSVINFLQKEHTKSIVQEQEWEMQKNLLNQKIASLQSELDSNITINIDLLNRIKMLQIALLQARTQLDSNQNNSKVNGNQLNYKDLQKKQTQLYKEIQILMKQHQIDEKIKSGGHQKFLKQALADIGISFKQIPVIKEDFSVVQKKISQQKYSYLNSNREQQFVKFSEKGSVVAHLDAVRGLYSNEDSSFIISISQDCLVKIWDNQSFWKNKTTHLEPLKTFREHTGPLFALTGSRSPFNPEQSLFFTGGSEGIIKYWSTKNSQRQLMKAAPVSFWVNSQKNTDDPGTVWSLALKNQNLLSSSSDGQIRHFKILSTSCEQQEPFNFINSYKNQQFKATCVSWLSPDSFIHGCSNSPRAHIYSIMSKSTKVIQKLLYEIDKGSQPSQSQINHIQYSNSLKIIGAGCEDGNLRLFNLSTNKIIRKIALNDKKESISSLKFMKQWQIVCSTHDGTLASIDLRNYQIIQQKHVCHYNKYDQSIFCLLNRGDELLSGGADGVVKIWI